MKSTAIPMVSPAVHSLPHWPSSPGGLGPSGSTATTLRTTVCQLPPQTLLGLGPSALGQRPAVAAAVQRLVAVVMELRSPYGGWPSHLEQTPDNLADYISEEIWDLLEVLQSGAVDGNGTATATSSPGPLIALPTLVSPLLWMLASSSYDTMHLIEGVRARVYDARAQFSLRLLRLVPVLSLTTDTTDYAWDLVTQNGAEPRHYLAPDTSLQLLDHDLDSQHLGLQGLLAQITGMAQRTQPGLSDLLGQGCEVMALSPFHPWQPGHLTLRLHLADLGPPQSPGTPAMAARPLAARSPSSPKPMAQAPSSSFTLEDFANTLGEDLEMIPLGVLGNWLTFTDELWVQGFLSSCAQRLMTQPLGTAANDENPEVNPERVWAERVYQATELVQGPNGLFKHTFVHAPILVADLWPRLRWYLAQSSERVMQLMGGLAAQALRPGQSWQRGNLYLRPLMQIMTPTRTVLIDLGSGKPVLTQPLALEDETVLAFDHHPAWAEPLTVEALAALIHQDLATCAPALVALRLGTSINLHCLETEAGCQGGRLTLDWCLTLQSALGE